MDFEGLRALGCKGIIFDKVGEKARASLLRLNLLTAGWDEDSLVKHRHLLRDYSTVNRLLVKY